MVLGPDDQIPIKCYRLGKMQSYEVLVSDFDRIESEATSIGTDLAFATACIPVGITINITLKTVSIADPLVKDPFLIRMFTCYILGAYFGVRAYRQRGRLKVFMQAIRDVQVAPLGEKGSEIGPSELAALPSEEQTNEGSEEEK
jgi:hypothetical protein